jgi:hypothetical protein
MRLSDRSNARAHMTPKSVSAGITKLRRQVDQIDDLKRATALSPQFTKWCRDTEIVIARTFGTTTRHLEDFKSVHFYPMAIGPSTDEHRFYTEGLEEARAILTSMIEELSEYGSPLDASTSGSSLPVARIEQIVDRFHSVARQLRQRHDSRATLDVEDEHDVQDLLHALLHIDFDDIRPEEWTPTYGGAAARVDFLLKSEATVIEVKKTRKGLGAKQVGEQLLIDIARYAAHPNCQNLIYFVYDPEGRIGNPRGIEADLTQPDHTPKVTVYIRPVQK